ncbi:TlpA family protein disulfide reductase [Rubrivirga sp. IMCC45206]|uniref:TlpA family protein disulfide reductase n=1 Tax=Rubrivirga sp. IMCC45206 TaxID=3391614 RepID=UPI00398FF25B
MTDADTTLRSTVSADGVHVVHVWAPWCDNARHEHAPVWRGWRDLGADSVTFVTVWSDGESGAGVLAEDGVEGVAEVVIPGPKPEKPDRRLTVLGVPVSWTPTTLVFNRNGLLATAFGYGEVTAEQLERAIDGARSGW